MTRSISSGRMVVPIMRTCGVTVSPLYLWDIMGSLQVYPNFVPGMYPNSVMISIVVTEIKKWGWKVRLRTICQMSRRSYAFMLFTESLNETYTRKICWFAFLHAAGHQSIVFWMTCGEEKNTVIICTKNEDDEWWNYEEENIGKIIILLQCNNIREASATNLFQI